LNNQAYIIVVSNQKGGVGKSTTADALAEGLLLKGKKTLLIDLDAQGSLTPEDVEGKTIYEVLLGDTNAEEAILKRENRVDLIPSSVDLTTLDMQLVKTGKERRLKKKLESIRHLYDFIVIDTPPTVNIASINALTAADYVIIPIQAEPYSIQGLSLISDTLSDIKEETNESLKLAGVLLTRHNPRNIISRDLSDTIREKTEELGTFVYGVHISESVAVKEAQHFDESIYTYAPTSKSAIDYLNFVEEFLDKIEPAVYYNDLKDVV